MVRPIPQKPDRVTQANILISWATFKLQHLRNVRGCREDLQVALDLCRQARYQIVRCPTCRLRVGAGGKVNPPVCCLSLCACVCAQGEANVYQSLGEMFSTVGAVNEAHRFYGMALELYGALQDDQNQVCQRQLWWNAAARPR